MQMQRKQAVTQSLALTVIAAVAATVVTAVTPPAVVAATVVWMGYRQRC